MLNNRPMAITIRKDGNGTVCETIAQLRMHNQYAKYPISPCLAFYGVTLPRYSHHRNLTNLHDIFAAAKDKEANPPEPKEWLYGNNQQKKIKPYLHKILKKEMKTYHINANWKVTSKFRLKNHVSWDNECIYVSDPLALAYIRQIDPDQYEELQKFLALVKEVS